MKHYEITSANFMSPFLVKEGVGRYSLQLSLTFRLEMKPGIYVFLFILKHSLGADLLTPKNKTVSGDVLARKKAGSN